VAPQGRRLPLLEGWFTTSLVVVFEIFILVFWWCRWCFLCDVVSNVSKVCVCSILGELVGWSRWVRSWMFWVYSAWGVVTVFVWFFIN
jgi:hypothetical protein